MFRQLRQLCCALLLLLCTGGGLVIAVSHHCVFDRLPRNVGEVTGGEEPASPVTVSVGSDWAPLRIKVFTDDLEGLGGFCTRAGEHVNMFLGNEMVCQEEDILTQEKVDILENVILSEAAKMHGERLLVRPLDGPLVVPRFREGSVCGKFPVPEEDHTDGVPDADMVLYATAVPTFKPTFAWAMPCATLGPRGRPVVGVINYNPRHIENTSQHIRVAVHEMAHALGFIVTDMEGQALVKREVGVRGRSSVHVVNSRNTLEQARRHYGCESAPGMELEFAPPMRNPAAPGGKAPPPPAPGAPAKVSPKPSSSETAPSAGTPPAQSAQFAQSAPAAPSPGSAALQGPGQPPQTSQTQTSSAAQQSSAPAAPPVRNRPVIRIVTKEEREEELRTGQRKYRPSTRGPRTGFEGGPPPYPPMYPDGVPDADMVLYATAVPTFKPTFAWAMPCATLGPRGRPVVGVINYNPRHIENTSQHIRVAVHEMAHALGFIVADMEGQALVKREVGVRGRSSVHVVNSRNTLEQARRHYGCESAPGMELEFAPPMRNPAAPGGKAPPPPPAPAKVSPKPSSAGTPPAQSAQFAQSAPAAPSPSSAALQGPGQPPQTSQTQTSSAAQQSSAPAAPPVRNRPVIRIVTKEEREEELRTGQRKYRPSTRGPRTGFEGGPPPYPPMYPPMRNPAAPRGRRTPPGVDLPGVPGRGRGGAAGQPASS
ncbi:surface protease GP63, putative [Trypanosoma cruzi]|nr:surface protease GP63, putative [Trypanosoma cruzi]